MPNSAIGSCFRPNKKCILKDGIGHILKEIFFSTISKKKKKMDE